MSKAEKENRINSLAVTFLERQQIIPNLYADQIIRGYKEGYHQAEKDLKLTWEDIKLLDKIFMNEKIMSGLILGEKEYEEILKRFKEEKKKIDN